MTNKKENKTTLTPKEKKEVFEAYRDWLRDGEYPQIARFGAELLNREMERICSAALLSEDTEAALSLVQNLSGRKEELTPENWAFLNQTAERLKEVHEAGGWLPIKKIEPAQTRENVFPSGVYPPMVDRYLASVAMENQTVPAMPCSAALAAFALSLQGKYKIAYPSGNSHTEHLNLYMGIVAEPSERKTPTFRHVIRNPFHAWRRSRMDDYSTKLSEYKAKQKFLEAKIGSIQRKALKGESDSSTHSELARLQAELDSLKKPVSPQFLFDDVTPEALGVKLQDTGEGAGIFSDEGCILQTLAGRYSDGKANIDLFLKAYSGEFASVDRITRDDIVLERPLLSMCLALQPGIYEDFASDKTLNERGLVARFLFCKPEAMAGKRNVSRVTQLDMEGYQVYEGILHKYLSESLKSDDQMPVIRWERAAANLMLEYLQKIEDAQAKGGAMAEDKAYAGKAGGAAVRIAGILHMVWTQDADALVSKETAHRAISLHRYFFLERLREMKTTSTSDLDNALAVKKKLYAHTVGKNKAFIYVREAFQRVRTKNGIRTAADFESVLELLQAEHSIDVTAGRNRRIYISPHLNEGHS